MTLPAISEAARRALLRTGAAMALAGTALLPVAGHSADGPVVRAEPAPWPIPTVAPHATYRARPLRRDPFRPLVDDAGSTAVRATLRAFADGIRPVALIETGGDVVPVRVGTAAFGSSVVALSRTGMRLADGRVIVFAEDAR